ncbi:ABC transporter substrate-binding protein [Jiangella endophytica]|uniref:ABC transporter substrate-binding protein n=1 Tax=Jiangella endophytica TaxID=1623398 RepID=UPI000E35294F|nr:ABC transporter substrate-binding protein [Jiangella endophytica]
MNSTRTAVALLTLAALSACGTGVTPDAPAATATGETVTLTNCGRELSFDAAPTRVVGMMPSQTELLLRLGLHDALVGQAQTATHPLPGDLADDAAAIPVLSTDAPPAREDLLAATPDLVVSPTEYEFTAEQGFASLDQLAGNGAAAYVATGGCAERRNTATVTDLLTDIADLGAIFRVPERADELTDEAEQRLAAVEAAIEGKPRPTVAQLFVEGNSLSAIGAGVEADIIRTAGGDNVFDPDAPEFANFFAAVIAPEEITSRDPEAIVFGVSSPAQEQQTRDYLARTFPDVTAVRTGTLVAVPASDLFPGTLGNIDAVELIAGALHPGS